MGNAQGRIWDTQQSMVDRLDKIEKRIAIMQEKIDGID